VAPETASIVLIALAGMVVAGLLILLVRRSMRAARRGIPGASSLGWALLFLSSGRMPPPPPATQIELDRQGDKDRLGSDTLKDDQEIAR
jgi:hypothetical protein